MPVRKHKPTSPARRFATWLDSSEVTKTRPEKSLIKGKTRSGGRNSHGRITSRHRGGGAKRRYRSIDFKRQKDGVPAKVAAIEYDPNRSANIALLHYRDGEKRYILAPQRLTVGMEVSSGQGAEIQVGNTLPLASIPTGTVIHNVELMPERGGPAWPFSRRRDPARREGGRKRDTAPSLGRDADGSVKLPCNDWRDRERGS